MEETGSGKMDANTQVQKYEITKILLAHHTIQAIEFVLIMFWCCYWLVNKQIKLHIQLFFQPSCLLQHKI